MEDQILKRVREFFATELERDRGSWPTASFFLIRQDGVLVHAQRSKRHKMKSGDEQSVGVLMGGVWQAACALMNLVPQSSKQDVFRLSFDTSDSGVYVLPVLIAGRSFYLGTLFAGETNPAHMKAKVRNFVTKFESHFLHAAEDASVAPSPAGPRRSDKNAEFLFKDLSDDEVDRLFSAAGI